VQPKEKKRMHPQAKKKLDFHIKQHEKEFIGHVKKHAKQKTALHPVTSHLKFTTDNNLLTQQQPLICH
jgi:hypothetical protein